MRKDIFSLLKDSGLPEQAQAGTIPVLSLWRVARYFLMFFTLQPEQFASHYDEEGAYLCPGASGGCPACQAGLRPTEHVYLPVWDAQNRRIAVLKFDTRPDGPSAKLLPFLQHHKDRLADVVAVIDCHGHGEFTITAHEPLPETDRGALECKAFADGLESGAIDLHNCVKRLAADKVAALPSVKRLATPVVGGVFRPQPERANGPAVGTPEV
jgi:hypothetical protein